MSKTITIKSSTGEIIDELAPFGLRLAARLIDISIIIIPNSIITSLAILGIPAK
jgi:hypothetical protein